jgi:hypothetical protein
MAGELLRVLKAIEKRGAIVLNKGGTLAGYSKMML